MARKITKRQFQFHNGRSGAAITVRVWTNARKNTLSGIDSDGTLEINLESDDSFEELNLSLIAFLSEILNIPKSKFEIIAGHKDKKKLISILDVTSGGVQEKVLEILN